MRVRLDEGFILHLLSILAFVLFAALALQLVRWKRMADTERELLRTDNAHIITAHAEQLKQTARAEAKLRRLEDRLIWRNPAELLPALADTANGLSLSLVGVEELRQWRRGGYNAVPLQLTLSGDYGGFADFLSVVERLTPTPRIEAVRLNEGSILHRYQRKQQKNSLWLSLTLSPMSKVGGSGSAVEIQMPPVERLSIKSNPFGFDDSAPPSEPVSETPLPELTGILWHGANPIAILGNESGGVGEVIADATILSIQPQRVVVQRGSQRRVLDLWQTKQGAELTQFSARIK